MPMRAKEGLGHYAQLSWSSLVILSRSAARAPLGVGRRLREQIADNSVRTALDLQGMDANQVQARWSVMLARTVHDLSDLVNP